MRIRNVSHKGLRLFITKDDARGLQPAIVEKTRRIVSFLEAMASEEELHQVPSWNAHRLTGDRRGVWSLSVTRNWRLTFRVDAEEVEIIDLALEDYH